MNATYRSGSVITPVGCGVFNPILIFCLFRPFILVIFVTANYDNHHPLPFDVHPMPQML
jgi:hypothetical protein